LGRDRSSTGQSSRSTRSANDPSTPTCQLGDWRRTHHGDPGWNRGPEPGPEGHIQAGANPGVSLYVQVGDLRSTIAKAIALGGKETIPPFDLENGQTLAAIEDPEGNFVMLVQQ